MSKSNKNQKQPSFLVNLLAMIFPFAFVCAVTAIIYNIYLAITGAEPHTYESNRFLGYIICVAIGLFFIITTFISWRKGITGFPLIGGLVLIFGGLLLAPTKWLCLLALLDPIIIGKLLPSLSKPQNNK